MSYLSAGFEPLPQTVFLCSQLVQCDQMLELNVAQKVAQNDRHSTFLLKSYVFKVTQKVTTYILSLFE